MDELLRSLKHFITRDVVYLVGGGTMMLAFSYGFSLDWKAELPVALYLLLAGIAYVLGYAAQDIAGTIRLARTIPPKKLFFPMTIIYRLFFGSKWKDITSPTDLHDIAFRLPDEQDRIRHERIVTLKQVGTTMGPSCLISSCFLHIRATATRSQIDTTLFWLSISLGFLFIVLAWLKAAEQSTFLDKFEIINGQVKRR
jgi:hypothetical protein